MDSRFTLAYARQVQKLREQEIELMVNLAKVAALQKIQQRAQEVR
jgi:hypothetical protein